MPRTREPRITDPATHPRRAVGLAVAAEWLGLSPRTVRARIEEGRLNGWRDGRVYRITLWSLRAYEARRRRGD